MPEFKLYLKQEGGRHGSFICPVCSNPSATWKFSGGSGWCDSCDASFCESETKRIIMPKTITAEYPDMIIGAWGEM